MRKILACLILAALATSARAIVGPSSDGGAQAAHVLMVLKRSARSSSFCSAVVVAPGVVLTAAHCVTSKANMKLHFRNASGQPVLLDVADVAIHPDFHADAQKSRVKTIDLALVKTTAPLPFTPAPLDASGEIVVGTEYLLAGFGLAREGDGKTGGTLRTGTLEARAPVSKILLWAKDRGNSGTGACTGDSGAPIFDASGTQVVAITAWADGAGKALCGSLTQGTLVAPVRGWIDGVLAGWEIN